MNVLLIWDEGDTDPHFYEVTGEHAQLALDSDGQFMDEIMEDNSSIEKLFRLFWSDDGDQLELPPTFRVINHKEPCGPFDAIVHCGQLP